MLDQPLFRSSTTHSLTSLCTIRLQETVVFGCPNCGHLQTPPLDDLDRYYESEYRILMDGDDQDQLYAIVGGRQVFRADHQAATLLARIDLPRRARVLDFGAAKGATMRRVAVARPDLAIHLFDVSDMWVSFWQRIVPAPSFATHDIPPSWSGSFDAVVSFFMLEHVERPVEVLNTMRSLLRPGGTLYLVVPNPVVNVADFVVVDHVNHFTASSLERALSAAGVADVTIDGEAHEGAWLATGRQPSNGGVRHTEQTDAATSLSQGRQLAQYWDGLRGRIQAAERQVDRRPAAVYGAGFYGSFIRANLEQPDRIVAYVDQNPYLQGTEHFGRPVVAPADLDPSVADVYVGLNPRVARSVIEEVAALRQRSIRFHYLQTADVGP